MNAKLFLLLLVGVAVHVFISPYTKVEESFNLQAIHDHLIYTPKQLQRYDHILYPGVVPRTFVGSLLLSLPLSLLKVLNLDILHLQYAARLLIGGINVFTTQILFDEVAAAFQVKCDIWMTVLTLSQFHYPFWSSRTLPNCLALPLVNLSHLYYIKSSTKKNKQSKYAAVSLALITTAAVVFRIELVAMIAPMVFQLWFNRRLSLLKIALIGGGTGLAALSTTVLVDSYFWSTKLLWPELSAFLFNVYSNKSSEWGVSPWSSYFLVHLPKLLMTALPLSVVALLPKSKHLPNEMSQKFITVHAKVASFQPLSLLFPPINYIFLLSFLGHKEWRFIMYVVPLFNAVAGLGMGRLCDLWKLNTIKMKMMALIPFVAILINLSATILLTAISSNNYPGGHALSRFHQLVDRDAPSTVHLDVLTAMTGASRFGERYRNDECLAADTTTCTGWSYSKNEDYIPDEATWRISSTAGDDDWHVVDSVRGFKGVSVRDMKVDIGDVLYIQQREHAQTQ